MLYIARGHCYAVTFQLGPHRVHARDLRSMVLGLLRTAGPSREHRGVLLCVTRQM